MVHKTGYFLRVERKGSWQALDVAELTDEELRREFSDRDTPDHLARWVVTLAGWIRDHVAFAAPRVPDACEVVFVPGSSIQALARLLGEVWRCNTDAERQAWGYLVGPALATWRRDPSHYLDPASPEPSPVFVHAAGCLRENPPRMTDTGTFIFHKNHCIKNGCLVPAALPESEDTARLDWLGQDLLLFEKVFFACLVSDGKNVRQIIDEHKAAATGSSPFPVSGAV